MFNKKQTLGKYISVVEQSNLCLRRQVRSVIYSTVGKIDFDIKGRHTFIFPTQRSHQRALKKLRKLLFEGEERVCGMIKHTVKGGVFFNHFEVCLGHRGIG